MDDKMNRIRNFNPLLKLALVLTLTAPLAACDSPVEQEDHPVAIVLVNAQGQNAVTIRGPQDVTGQITVAPNASQAFTVFALSESGSRLSLAAGEMEIRIGSQAQNAVAVLQGVNQLTVQGRTAGTGTLNLVLTHEGHDELAGNVSVVVQ